MRKLRVLTFEEWKRLIAGVDRLGHELKGCCISGLEAGGCWQLQVQARDVALLALMGEAGLRLAEVQALNWGELVHVGHIRLVLQIRNSHGDDRVRDVPMSPLCLAAVTRLWALERSLFGPPNVEAPVFRVRGRQRRLSRRAIQRMVRVHGNNVLGRRVWCHLLRHTYATRMARVLDIRGVQEVLGHKRVETTQVYTHPSVSDAVEAASSL